jgi:hypothetical protein
MKKSIKWSAISVVTLIFIVALAGVYKFNYLSNQEGHDVDGNEIKNTSKQPITKTITWEQMVVEIQKGQYTALSQDHSKGFKLVSTDGTIYESVQPKIDAYHQILENCKNCPKVPVASE